MLPQAGAIEPVAPPSPNGSTTPAPTDWRTFMTDDLKADPVVSGWAEKASEKDVPSLIKTLANAQKRMGSAINLPGKDAKPEEMTALKTKLIEAGVLPKPIADPKEYAIAKPENLPAGRQWSDELSTKFATTLHKHQIPKEAVADLMALHVESLGGAVESFAQDNATVIAEMQREHGEKYEERRALAERLIPEIIKSDADAALANKLGLGDNARFISLFMRFAPFAQQDSSFMEKLGTNGDGSGVTREHAKKELEAIMTDPKHPMYDGFRRHDQKVLDHIAQMYKNASSEAA